MPLWTSAQRLIVEALRGSTDQRLDLGRLQHITGLRALALVNALECLEQDGTLEIHRAGGGLAWSLRPPAEETLSAFEDAEGLQVARGRA